MAARIGANISSVEELANASSGSGEAAVGFHATATKHAQSFQDQVAEMASTVKTHMGDFSDQLDQEADVLVQKMDATDWEGASQQAKVERLDQMRSQVATMKNELDDGVQTFETELNTAIQNFYTAVADKLGTSIESLNETLQAESKHAQGMADALVELDQAAAGGGA